MRHRSNKKVLDRKSDSRRALVRSMVINFILSDKIKTTAIRARIVRSAAERLVTVAKVNSLTARRKLLSYLNHPAAVKRLLEVLGPKYVSHKGGYTRIIKLSQRKGDAAKIVLLQFI
jgi:large subunit ribosomal protein L17